MNHRDCALAAMRGRPVDRIPFIARMDLWYAYHRNGGTLPPPYEHASLWDIQRDLGIGIFGFGVWDISFFRLVHHGVEVEKTVNGERTTTRYRTPYGNLVAVDVMATSLQDAAGSPARVKYPFSSNQDYDALRYLIEHTEVVENLEAYDRFVQSIGGDGLALPFSGHLPAHQLMLNFMGYETFYLEWHDHASCVDSLIEALTEQQTRVLDLAVQCSAEAIEVGGNYDEQMTPYRVFDRVFAPFYRQARQKLSSKEKILVVHGDGDMKVLLERIRDCGVQVVEAISPKPMTSIDVASTRQLWGDRVAMWGGLASIVLTDAFTDEQFESHMVDLFRSVAPGDGFVLGFGDNVPTDALFHRVRRVAEFWAEHGAYPLKSARA